MKLFFLSAFSFTGTDDSQGKGGDHLLFHSTTSTRSQTLRHFFANLHVTWLSRIFNRKRFPRISKNRLNTSLVFTILLLDEIYHHVELPFDWLIDDAIGVCMLDELALGFCYSDFDMGNRWIWTRIDYHPCITSEPINQVWWSPRVWSLNKRIPPCKCIF